ncbi:hypothetical protein [Geosporobacter ferrireducens]|uniref:Flagellar hook-length control protein-like C-terminal domain-containing protein n=1 Tax=Geosporobacter ferrireducens TaxID=1424294 RepID=A0A1D8GBU5_9FIRM|nr:hypothetical protein [Geosporobacter ferrireducens]AOT68379.1 hypothetical protein Gferi_01480 [Geosporobacter ferrireducens]
MKIHNECLTFNIPSQQNKEESSGSLKEGQTIRAKINQIAGEIVLLNLGNGETVQAKLTMPLPLKTGQLCDFLVKEIQDHQILLKPVLDDAEAIRVAEQKITSLLEKMGLTPDKEKIEIVKEMIRFQLPIQANTLKEISSLKTAYEKVSDWMHLLPLKGEDDLSEHSIQTVLKRVLSTEINPEHGVKATVNHSGTETGFNETKEKTGETVLLNVESKIANKMTKGSVEIAEKPAEGTMEKPAIEYSSGESEAKRPVPKTGFNLQNMTYEKIIFLLKNNFQGNIQNASNINQILFHTAPVGKQLEDIVGALKGQKEIEQLVKNLEDIGSRIKPSLIQDKESVKEVIKELYNTIQNIKDLAENGAVKIGKEVIQQLDSLKSGIDFINKINDYQGFLQLPIQIKGEQRNLEIVLCNKKKKNSSLNPSDLKIFISLDTKSLDTVQAFIEIKEKYVAVNFRLISEQVKNYVVKHESSLHTALKTLGFTKVDTNYSIFKDKLDLITVLEQEALFNQKKHNFVDLWV